MTSMLKAGVASTMLTLALSANTAAYAADFGGSIKDNYVPAAAPMMMGGVGPCYFRGDVGYSLSRDPSVKWPVFNEEFAGDNGSGNGVINPDEVNYVFAGDRLNNVSLENT